MLAPKAIYPPVWLLSLLACAIGGLYSYMTLKHDTPTDRAVEPALEEQYLERSEEIEEIEHPTEQFTLGRYLYQYFAENSSHQAYFRLLDSDHEIFKNARADVTYHLVVVRTSNLTPYDRKPDSDFVAQLNDKRKVIIVEEIEQTTDQHRYLLIELAAPSKILSTLETGTNQFCVEQSLHGYEAKYQLIGFDHLDGWGQQSVNPKATFDLQCKKGDSKIFTWHKSRRRSAKALITASKKLQKQFADLDIYEDAPITYAPVELAGEMAELIYEGNDQQAKILLDSSWPANRKGKAKFAKAFYAELAKGVLKKELPFN